MVGGIGLGRLAFVLCPGSKGRARGTGGGEGVLSAADRLGPFFFLVCMMEAFRLSHLAVASSIG